ncbi:hypothetical protein [Pararhizobium haloflavum]|uniref:hypothetical protein n=1 Tax=Pararhizobium haloflavum TaxID=2037914 RepID=UPI000C1A457F|nr:hypothetical protein [Pararhizobium haloflavum]
MGLFDLVMTVCLIAQPGDCRLERIGFDQGDTAHSCMFLAPMEIARWADTHPGLQVKRWKCAPHGERDI